VEVDDWAEEMLKNYLSIFSSPAVMFRMADSGEMFNNNDMKVLMFPFRFTSVLKHTTCVRGDPKGQ
jgi:hypothetical protein